MSELAPITDDNHTSVPVTRMRAWQRTDDELRDAVCEALLTDSVLDARDMNIGVDDGDVILSGVCPCVNSRARAESIARGVLGVREVHNFVGIRAT